MSDEKPQKQQLESLEESNMNLCIAHQEQRERIESLEKTNKAQREALKISHDEADELRGKLKMLQT